MPNKYRYGKACVINGPISINGRFWRAGNVFDFVDHSSGRDQLAVAKIVDFVLVVYKHKYMDRMRGRVKPTTLEGKFFIVRARQYKPTPSQDDNMWLAPEHPVFHVKDTPITVVDLCAFLHAASERSGRAGYVHLLKVAQAFVL